ncbi:protein of unknown function [Streptomyces sp. KY70]|nr:protein of unknown function [Streptomyces sp. KY70]
MDGVTDTVPVLRSSSPARAAGVAWAADPGRAMSAAAVAAQNVMGVERIVNLLGEGSCLGPGPASAVLHSSDLG